MTSYKNSEGYPDPTAGEAIERVARDNRHAAKEKERIETRKRFENTCVQMRRLANKNSFDILGEIRLRDRKTGFIYKNKR